MILDDVGEVVRVIEEAALVLAYARSVFRRAHDGEPRIERGAIRKRLLRHDVEAHGIARQERRITTQVMTLVERWRRAEAADERNVMVLVVVDELRWRARATLYKYFHQVEEVATAWHERQVERHYARLEVATHRPGRAIDRVKALLDIYAVLAHEEHGTERTALMRRTPHVADACARLDTLIQTLLSAAVEEGDVRDDVPASELAAYAVSALEAASSAPSRAAVRRLVGLTLDALSARS